MLESRRKRIQEIKKRLKEKGFKEDGLTNINVKIMEKALTNEVSFFQYGILKFDLELNSLEKTLGIIP